MMRAVPASVPAIFPTSRAQFFRLPFVVPHAPEPTTPVTTLNLVGGRRPFAVIVTGVAVATSQPVEFLDVVRHSMMKTLSPGLKP